MTSSYTDFLVKLLDFKFDYSTFWKLLTHGGGAAFPYKRAMHWSSEHIPFAMQLSIAYLVVIFSVQRFMRDQTPFSLRLPLALWNFILAVFSTIMTYKFIKEFIYHHSHGMMYAWCYAGEFVKKDNGYWAFLFVASKMFEMGDTLFIVLRKRPLIFLHWFHHIVTMVYVVWAYPLNPSGNRYGFLFNAIAHSVMYSYYFLRAIDFPVPRWVAKCVTLLQITQFCASLFFYPLLALIIYFTGKTTCDFKWDVFWLGVAMHFCYLILFLQFFFKAYYPAHRERSKSVERSSASKAQDQPKMTMHEHELYKSKRE